MFLITLQKTWTDKNMYGLSYEGGVSCKLNSSEHHLKSSYRRHNADVIMVKIK